MAKISFYTDSPHGRTIIVCYRSDFTNFCFSVRILSNTKKNSLFHTVGYKNHSVGYIFHSVGYKSRTVKQRICKSVLKNVTGYAELINRAERIITYSDLHGKGYCKLITTRAVTYPVTALVVIKYVFNQYPDGKVIYHSFIHLFHFKVFPEYHNSTSFNTYINYSHRALT